MEWYWWIIFLLIVAVLLAMDLGLFPATISILPEIVERWQARLKSTLTGDPAWDRRAQSVGLWRAGGVGRLPYTPGTGSRWRSWVKFVLEMLRQEFDTAMALSGLPKAHRHHERSCSSLVGLGNVPGSASAPARLRSVSFRSNCRTAHGFRRFGFHPHVLIQHKIISRRAVTVLTQILLRTLFFLSSNTQKLSCL